MLNIKCFPLGPLQTNTYLIYDLDSLEGILIDPAGDLKEVENYIKDGNIKIKYIVNTHEHTDHTAHNKEAKEKFKDAFLAMHPLTAQEGPKWTNSDFGKMLEAQEFIAPDILLNEGDEINLGVHTFKVLYTPGHSLGSICLFEKASNILICGDLIFRDSIGRYDLPGSSYEDLKKSIKRLSTILNDNTKIFPGHGPFTTWGRERKFNTFIIDILNEE